MEDGKDLWIIGNLYWNQMSFIKAISIGRGVSQGCVLFPLLFNIYSEQIFREALEEVDEELLLNGERINNIRYADDTAVMPDNLKDLHHLMTKINKGSNRYGLEFNISKTKYMIISKSPVPATLLMVKNQQTQRTPQYSYLGTMINEQWDHSQEIRCRIEKS